VYTYIYSVTTTCNRIQIQNISAKSMQTTTTVWPVLCDPILLRKSELSYPIEQNINETQKRELFQVFAKYLSSMTARPGRCKLFKYKFQAEADRPILGYSRLIPFALTPPVREQMD
jgi:hypothetical protein